MLKIEIEVPYDVMAAGQTSDYIANALAALGYSRTVGPHAAVPAPAETTLTVGDGKSVSESPVVATGTAPAATGTLTNDAPAAEAPKEPAKRGRKPKDPAPASAAEVSVAQDDAATQAQDKADEQAESQPAEDAPKTQEDVRQAMMAYGGAYGMPALQEDGRAIFEKALGEAPLQPDGTPYKNKMGKDAVDDDGKRYWMLPMVTTPEQCAAAVRYWDNAREVNPFKREPVKAG